MDRVGKENGEFSASGESAESIELKATQINSDKNGDLKEDNDLEVVLREQLIQLDTINQQSPEQREQELSRLLLLFIQVQ